MIDHDTTKDNCAIAHPRLCSERPIDCEEGPFLGEN
jgi:hypothetical protein